MGKGGAHYDCSHHSQQPFTFVQLPAFTLATDVWHSSAKPSLRQPRPVFVTQMEVLEEQLEEVSQSAAESSMAAEAATAAVRGSNSPSGHGKGQQPRSSAS